MCRRQPEIEDKIKRTKLSKEADVAAKFRYDKFDTEGGWQ
jgi:hypothetical protein